MFPILSVCSFHPHLLYFGSHFLLALLSFSHTFEEISQHSRKCGRGPPVEGFGVKRAEGAALCALGLHMWLFHHFSGSGK